MAAYAILIIVIAKVTVLVVNKYILLPQSFITLFEYFGYFCWVTVLGSPGWTIMTWSQGDTPEERLDQSISMGLSLIGVFAFVLARELVVV